MCRERQRLLEQCATTVLAYSEIARTFKDAQYRPGFDQVVQKADQARVLADAARTELERHVVAHGCGQVESLAALG